MKAYIIQSGHFSQAGNFIGFSTKGERVHIYKKQIFNEFPDVETIYNCVGQCDPTLIPFPFYCIADHMTFDHVDVCGNRTGEKFTRLTAVEISESTLGIVEHAITDWVADLEHAVSDRAADQVSKELERAKKNYRRLENKYDELSKKHDALVAKVDHYDANYKEQEFLIRQQVEQEIGYEQYMYDQLAQENDKLKDDFNAMKWNYEYAQTERERLEILCKQQENLIYDYKHILGKIKGLSSVDDDIINTIY